MRGRNASKQNPISGKTPHLAAKLCTNGLAVLMIDLRGHGESEGKCYTLGFHEWRDIPGAIDFHVGYGFDINEIYLLGISLGGAAVICAPTIEPAVGVLIVESTFSDFNELAMIKQGYIVINRVSTLRRAIGL